MRIILIQLPEMILLLTVSRSGREERQCSLFFLEEMFAKKNKKE